MSECDCLAWSHRSRLGCVVRRWRDRRDLNRWVRELERKVRDA